MDKRNRTIFEKINVVDFNKTPDQETSVPPYIWVLISKEIAFSTSTQSSKFITLYINFSKLLILHTPSINYTKWMLN